MFSLIWDECDREREGEALSESAPAEATPYASDRCVVVWVRSPAALTPILGDLLWIGADPFWRLNPGRVAWLWRQHVRGQERLAAASPQWREQHQETLSRNESLALRRFRRLKDWLKRHADFAGDLPVASEELPPGDRRPARPACPWKTRGAGGAGGAGPVAASRKDTGSDLADWAARPETLQAVERLPDERAPGWRPGLEILRLRDWGLRLLERAARGDTDPCRLRWLRDRLAAAW